MANGERRIVKDEWRLMNREWQMTNGG